MNEEGAQEEVDYQAQGQAEAEAEGEAQFAADQEAKEKHEAESRASQEYVGDEPDQESMAKEQEDFKRFCKNYADTKKELTGLNEQCKERTKVIDEQIATLNGEKQTVYKELFKDKIDKLNESEMQLKDDITSHFPEGEKSIGYEFGKFDLRTRKAIKIPNEQVLVDILVKKGLINKAIKTFDTAWLKKVREADVLSDCEVNLVENKSLAFTPKKEGGN